MTTACTPPGLWASVGALKDVGDVIVVAPDREQSGVGTAITLNNPVHVREVIPAHRGGQGLRRRGDARGQRHPWH